MALREVVTVYLNTEVEEINITDSAFKVKVKRDRGEKEFCAMIGIIATGFELNFPGRRLNRPKDFLYGIQTEVIMEDVSDVEVYFGRKIAPWSFAWVVPTNGGSAKVGLITEKNPATYLKRFFDNPLIRHRVSTCGNQVKCSPIPLGRIPKSYGERLIIVGEAAGQVKTTTGGGIYFGLLCSEIGARIILKAFENRDFSEKALEEYEIAWREKIEPELKAGIVLRNLFSKLSDYQIDLLMDLAKKDGMLPIIKKTNFDWHRDIIASLLRRIFSKINPL